MLNEFFPAFEKLSRVRAAFVPRVPGIDVTAERAEVLRRLEATHQLARQEAGMGGMVFATAEQVHGNKVVEVFATSSYPVPGADGLFTITPGICLGIYVADCAAVYLVDRQARGIALVHSGKKGTELGISSVAVEALCGATGADPQDLIAQISPCIRPPHYEINFAAEIVSQLRDRGVGEVVDCGICTACHPDLYYSYRMEKGRTGRMLATLAMLP